MASSRRGVAGAGGRVSSSSLNSSGYRVPFKCRPSLEGKKLSDGGFGECPLLGSDKCLILWGFKKLFGRGMKTSAVLAPHHP